VSITVHTLAFADYPQYRGALIDLLIDVVDHGASVNFLAPLDRRTAETFWDRVGAQVETRERVILLALDAGQLVGTAQLVLATQPNGLHRAEVQKVLVHSTQRRRGIGTLLMTATEAAARQHQRTTLILDTETDSDAESLYRKAGYLRLGVIPDYALDTRGRLQAATVFYKLL